MAGVIVVAYIFYTVSDDVIIRLQNDNLYITSFFVILGIIGMTYGFVHNSSPSIDIHGLHLT